ncbi:5270_t:CDS:2 [Paraglomus occultum]|uniref:DASH complex subunit DAM1 n=1 Tax=Paraglomus occultum TaxID=144539 RepID=A0A9N8YR94_9GLOM|nr:5270_t:CDS:2 [Paraglomus occultum]
MSLIKRPDQPQRKSISRAFRASSVPLNNNVTPLDILEGQLAGLADAFAGLQAKFENLQELHETLLTFNQSFSAFLYGIKMNAHCVEFPEAPTAESFQHVAQKTGINLLSGHLLFFFFSFNPSLDAIILGCVPITPRKLFLRPPQTPKREPDPQPILELEPEPELKPEPKVAPEIERDISDEEDSSQKEEPKPPQSSQSKVKTTSKQVIQPSKSRAMNIKKFVTRLTNGLPLKYREQQPHRNNMELMVKLLVTNPEGLYMQEFVRQTMMPRVRCNEYLNALVHAKEVVKINRKGQLFRLDPVKYPFAK